MGVNEAPASEVTASEISESDGNMETLQLGRFCTALRNHDEKEHMIRRSEVRARSSSDSSAIHRPSDVAFSTPGSTDSSQYTSETDSNCYLSSIVSESAMPSLNERLSVDALADILDK